MVIGGKKINRCLISIIIIKLIINLTSWYYYSYAVYNHVLRPKIVSERNSMYLKVSKKSHKKH